MPQEKPKKKLTKQEQNLIDATKMEKMRPVFKGPNSYIVPTKKRPDTPLAPTPEPKTLKNVPPNSKTPTAKKDAEKVIQAAKKDAEGDSKKEKIAKSLYVKK